MCILTWEDATNYGDVLPIPCSLFDETLPSFINEKTPIKKGEKGGTRRADQHSKKG
jgi:hypothetical protein